MRDTIEIWEIDRMLGLKKENNNLYSGVICTGKFEAIGDYGRGILQLSILFREKTNECLLIISTIDDGIWQAEATFKNKDTYDKLVEDFTNEFGQVLPTENEFNVFLRKYGLYGLNTG